MLTQIVDTHLPMAISVQGHKSSLFMYVCLSLGGAIPQIGGCSSLRPTYDSNLVSSGAMVLKSAILARFTRPGVTVFNMTGVFLPHCHVKVLFQNKMM